MKISLREIIFIGILISILSSCIEVENYPNTPVILYKSLNIKDSIDKLDNPVKICRLAFEVKDGDADIGLSDSDTIGKFSPDSIYFNNVFVKLFEQKNGKLNMVNLELPLNFRSPYIPKKKINKSLKAEIEIKMEFALNKFHYDTVMFEVQIVDRNLNKSNIIQTPTTPINTNP